MRLELLTKLKNSTQIRLFKFLANFSRLFIIALILLFYIFFWYSLLLVALLFIFNILGFYWLIFYCKFRVESFIIAIFPSPYYLHDPSSISFFFLFFPFFFLFFNNLANIISFWSLMFAFLLIVKHIFNIIDGVYMLINFLHIF